MIRCVVCGSVYRAGAGERRARVRPGVAGERREDRRAGLQEHQSPDQGTPANELNQSMHLMKGATGMDCLYCHIEREWEKDVKPRQRSRARDDHR